ncbi:MAG: hypothetical protein Q4F80_08080 [bacterium]|nr:hypothetical protein [bacterium]
MLKRQQLPTSNNSKSVIMILNGAKKRRLMAHSAVKAVNTELGFKPDLATVK